MHRVRVLGRRLAPTGGPSPGAGGGQLGVDGQVATRRWISDAWLRRPPGAGGFDLGADARWGNVLGFHPEHQGNLPG